MGLTQTPAAIGVDVPQALKQIVVKLVKLAFQFAIGLGLIAGMMQLLPPIQYEPTSSVFQGLLACLAPVLLLLLVIVPLYLSIIFHEFGHMLGGALAGFRFVLLVAGPLKIVRQKHGVRLGYSGYISTAGSCVTASKDDRDLSRRLVLFIAGGPIASLLQLAIFYLLLFILRHTLVNFWLGETLNWLAVFSAIMFLVSVWPYRSWGFMTDGARVVTLLRGGPQAERLRAIFALSGASASGQRPRDRNPIWLQRALACSDGTGDEAFANFFAYFHALDNAEPDQAAPFLDRALSLRQKSLPFLQTQYFLEAAYFEARHGHGAAAGRTWLKQAGGGQFMEPYTRLRAEAAVLLAEGDLEAAYDCAIRGLAKIRFRYPFDRGLAKAERDWLKDIARQIRALPVPSLDGQSA